MCDTLGERIVFARNARGLMQKDLAAKVGITAPALNYYEKNKREPSMEILKEMAQALNVPVAYFYGEGLFKKIEFAMKNTDILRDAVAQAFNEEIVFGVKNIVTGEEGYRTPLELFDEVPDFDKLMFAATVLNDFSVDEESGDYTLVFKL